MLNSLYVLWKGMYLNLSPDNCEYRGEGNTGLVISLKQEGKVLRLIKQEDSCQDAKNSEQLLQQMEDEISMIKFVLKPLLGKDLANCPAIIPLQADDVRLLNSIVQLQRPCNRVHKNVKEEGTFGLLLPDYCTLPSDLKDVPSFGPVLSVEIKPKPGFLLKETYLDPSHFLQSLLLCHFCRKQVYKMKKGEVVSRSLYCPTDLFSGCPRRMLWALKMLLQYPQNNIRIFKDQKLIFSEEKKNNLEESLVDFFEVAKSSCVDRFCNLVLKVLLKSIPCKPDKSYELMNKCDVLKCVNSQMECSPEGDCHVLPKDSVLHRILNLQMLDKLDIQSVYYLYNQIKESSDEKSNYIGCFSRSEIPPHLGLKEKAENESDYQYASRKVWEFIVALIAKDCSIMLVLQNYSGSDSNLNPNLISDDSGNQYLFSVAVADLDTKPLSRIKKHYDRTPKWLQSCLSKPV